MFTQLQLNDRLLASVPYSDEEYDTESPLATRDVINDLFGPINMDTVAQTIHFRPPAYRSPPVTGLMARPGQLPSRPQPRRGCRRSVCVKCRAAHSNKSGSGMGRAKP